MGPKKTNIVFGHFPTTPDYFNVSEDYRRLTKMSDNHRSKMSAYFLGREILVIHYNYTITEYFIIKMGYNVQRSTKMTD